MQLAPAIATYFATADGSDPAAFAAAFTPDAEVTDEGHTYRGPAEITQWRNSANTRYTVTATPQSVKDRDELRVVKALVEGDFPKAGLPDPLYLEYRFKLIDGRIASLSIGLARDD